MGKNRCYDGRKKLPLSAFFSRMITRDNRWGNKKIAAYLTVEASLLMPLVVLGIVFSLFLGFYLYNITILRQVAYLAALRGSLLREEANSSIEEYTKKQLEELVEGRLIAVDELGCQVEVSLHQVRVKVFLETYSPFVGLLVEEAGVWKFEAEAKARRLVMTDFIHEMRRVKGNKEYKE